MPYHTFSTEPIWNRSELSRIQVWYETELMWGHGIASGGSGGRVRGRSAQERDSLFVVLVLVASVGGIVQIELADDRCQPGSHSRNLRRKLRLLLLRLDNL